MRANLHRLLLLLFVCLWTSSAGATVAVSFTRPENYADMGQYPEDMRTQMDEIEAHLKQLGQRYLPPDQSLKIEVLDVDLAGRIGPPTRPGSSTRVLRGKADWPRIKLHYVLEAGGRVLLDREESVADMDYLRHANRHYAGQSLSFEKQMLDDWFRQRFSAHKR